MAKPHKKQQQFKGRTPNLARRDPETEISAPAIRRKKGPVRYGTAFTLLEDASKKTFEYSQGAWVVYLKSIEECRKDCLVTKLGQKINNMTRYEIRPILTSE